VHGLEASLLGPRISRCLQCSLRNPSRTTQSPHGIINFECKRYLPRPEIGRGMESRPQSSTSTFSNPVHLIWGLTRGSFEFSVRRGRRWQGQGCMTTLKRWGCLIVLHVERLSTHRLPNSILDVDGLPSPRRTPPSDPSSSVSGR
jgi:hypothetical protein